MGWIIITIFNAMYFLIEDKKENVDAPIVWHMPCLRHAEKYD